MQEFAPKWSECCPIGFREQRNGFYPRSQVNAQREFHSERRGERTVVLDDNEEELEGKRWEEGGGGKELCPNEIAKRLAQRNCLLLHWFVILS